MKPFSVVVPIYREEQYLPYSLPSIYKLKPREVLLLFDSPEDIEIAVKISRKCNYYDKTIFIDLTKVPSPNWRCRIAFARRYGFRHATYDIILNTDADTVLDPRLGNYIDKVGKKMLGLISFSRIGYPIRLRDALSFFAQRILPVGFTGLYVFYRPFWEETEDLEELKSLPSAEDTHLYLSMRKKYRTAFVKNLRNYHLRVIETFEKHFLTGQMKFRVSRVSLWRILLHSVFYARPGVLSGYLAERAKSKLNTT